MANITIENYRGIEIWFDTDNESFQCDVDDSRSVKKSYPALKKFIDEWKKENEVFKPFKVEPNPNGGYIRKQSGTIVGIRKDGRYMIELSDGKKEQISDYDLRDYILAKPKHSELWDELKKLENEEVAFDKEIRSKRQAIRDQFDITTLVDYRKANK